MIESFSIATPPILSHPACTICLVELHLREGEEGDSDREGTKTNQLSPYTHTLTHHVVFSLSSLSLSFPFHPPYPSHYI